MPVFQADSLRSIAREVLVAADTPPEDAKWIAETMVMANLQGHDSHGILLLTEYLDLILNRQIIPGVKIMTTKDLPTLTFLDGNWNFGQIVARELSESIAMKGEKNGFAIGAAFHCNHVGRLGTYAHLLADRNLIGIFFANNPGGSFVAPWGGIQRKLGTNPIAIAVPRIGAPPVVLDIATSVVAAGKVLIKVGTGESVPEGWIIDKNGRASTTPEDLGDGGAVLPAGTYKGFGLGLMVDILAGSLTGAGGFNARGVSGTNGVLGIALRPDLFLSRDSFDSSVESIIRDLLSSPLQTGFSKIFLPGQKGEDTFQQRMKEGIVVHEVIWNKLSVLAQEFGVDLGSRDKDTTQK